jgi:hypothetical protein
MTRKSHSETEKQWLAAAVQMGDEWEWNVDKAREGEQTDQVPAGQVGPGDALPSSQSPLSCEWSWC